MPVKKTGARFTLQFNQDDPKHLRVIDMLNRQGWHGKAQYIVDAVTHFINCDRERKNSHPAQIDERHIETVVRRILHERQASEKSNHVAPTAHTPTDEEITYADAADTLGEAGYNAIAGALDMFRKK